MSAIILLIVRLYKKVNTRVLINVLAQLPGMNKHRICGYLSWLKRSKQIKITTIVPHKHSEAY